MTFDGADYTATDTVTVTADQAPDFTFDKSGAPSTYSAAGDSITYTYVIANTGNTTLGSLSAIDSVEGPVTFSPTLVAPGQSATATIVHTVTQADVDAGSITNVATATVTFDGADYTATDTVTVTADQAPDFTFDKSGAPSTYSAAGDSVTYTYVIANTGNTTLGSLSAIDSVEGPVTFSPTLVAPGQSATATIIHTVTQADVDAGSITNVATATVTFDGADYTATDTVTVTADQAPDFTFDKSGAPSTYSAAGDSVTYTYVIANTGNTTLGSLSAIDSVEGPVTFSPTLVAPSRAPRPRSSTPSRRPTSTPGPSPTSPRPR